MPLRVESLVVGPLQANCYLVRGENERDAVVIDPGDESERIAERCREDRLRVQALLLTHGHVDHITGVGPLARQFGVPVVLHPDERALYLSPDNAVSPVLPACRDLPETVATLPGTLPWHIDMLPTPGHSAGGVCYHFPKEQIVFTGDTLFCGSVGRTDLPGGDMDALTRSIQSQLLTLPDNTAVCPGHGPQSMIGEERDTNPFLS